MLYSHFTPDQDHRLKGTTVKRHLSRIWTSLKVYFGFAPDVTTEDTTPLWTPR